MTIKDLGSAIVAWISVFIMFRLSGNPILAFLPAPFAIFLVKLLFSQFSDQEEGLLNSTMYGIGCFIICGVVIAIAVFMLFLYSLNAGMWNR